MSREGKPGEGALGRWSRLKRARAEGEEPEAPPTAEAPEAALEAKTDEEILEELGLPDPETLSPGDDVTGFMAKAVPARLRNRALRKLWVSNPVLANLDELVDYGDDFTDAATVVEGLASAWQAGRGYLTEPDPAPAPEAERPEDPAPETADMAEEAADTAAADADTTEPAEATPADIQSDRLWQDVAQPAPAAEMGPPTRRMRFRLAAQNADRTGG